MPLGVLEQLRILSGWNVTTAVHLKRSGDLAPAFRSGTLGVTTSPIWLQGPIDVARFRGRSVPRSPERRLASRVIDRWRPRAMLVESAACLEFVIEAGRRDIPCLFRVHEVGGLLDRLWGTGVPQLDCVVAATPSSAGREQVAERLGRRPRDVAVLASPVDLADVRRRAAASIPDAASLVGCGVASEVKGTDRFVELALRLSRDGVTSVWLGEGPLRAPLRRRSRRGGSGLVQLPGEVPDPVPFLGAAELVVIPSREEAMSRIAIEALATGTPVVAADVGGLRDVVGPGGVLLDASDPDALERVVRSLLADDAERTRLGQAGSDHVSERFSAEGFQRKFQDALDLIGVRPSGEADT